MSTIKPGEVFGRLTVTELISVEHRPREVIRIYRCSCLCGGSADVKGKALKGGHKKSCGCLLRENKLRLVADETIHGQTGTRLHQCWRRMLSRCYTPSATGFDRYGGRGISVCPEWRSDFRPFHQWALANGYRDDFSIDRIDGDGNYSPDNCRWLSLGENAARTSKCRYLTAFGERKNIADWLRDERCGASRVVIKRRLAAGWEEEAAVSVPMQIHASKKTHCKHGHPFDEANTSLDCKGRRTCRTCQLRRGRAYEEKQKLKRCL